MSAEAVRLGSTAPQGAAVCIGVSTYVDGRLTSCPAAARTAGAMAAALGATVSGGATAATDPKGSYELLLAIQAAAQKARGGTFILYFAGVTIRRGDDLLLTTCATSLDGKTESVAWSDVDAILEHEKVACGLVLLNAEGFAGVGWGGAAAPTVHGMGSVRIHDPMTADRRIAEYGAAVLDALAGPAWDLRDHLSDGRLDIPALDRYLGTRAPAPPRSGPPPRGEAPRHETFGTPEPMDVVLRDLREELARGAPPPPLVRADTRSAAEAAGEQGPPSGSPVRWIIAAAAVLAVALALVLLRMGT